VALSNIFGYDTYMIAGLRNARRGSEVIGFELQLRIANYRGYILSQIEDIRVNVDGRAVKREAIRFTIESRTYTLDQMESVIDDRWEILQVATVLCLESGGLAAGPHTVTVEEHIRASYIPFTAVSVASKVLELAA
jgi:hypothetical protein